MKRFKQRKFMTSINKYSDLIEKTIEVLKSGGTILYPTDTIWGLGCDASNKAAVDKIYTLKKRAESKSLIILVDDDKKVNRYIKNVPEAAWNIFDYATKPTTIILDEAVNIASNIVAEDGSVGIRICKQEFCSSLIRKYGKAIVSTSANISGEPSPSSFLEISDEIKNNVDFIVDIPEFYSSKNPPSSILKISKYSEVKILRK